MISVVEFLIQAWEQKAAQAPAPVVIPVCPCPGLRASQALVFQVVQGAKVVKS